MDKTSNTRPIYKVIAFFCAVAAVFAIGMTQVGVQQAQATELDSYQLQAAAPEADGLTLDSQADFWSVLSKVIPESVVNEAKAAIEDLVDQAKQKAIEEYMKDPVRYSRIISQIQTEADKAVADIKSAKNLDDLLHAGQVHAKVIENIVSDKGATIDISQADVQLKKTKMAYTGKTLKCGVESVTVEGIGLVAGTDYKVTYTNNVNAGKAKVTITGQGSFSGTKTATFKITKATNTITATSPVKKTYAANAKTGKLAQTKTFSFKTTPKFGKAVYQKKTSGVSNITVSKAGKVTVKSGLSRGTYTVKVKAAVPGTANYSDASKTLTLKVTIK